MAVDDEHFRELAAQRRGEFSRLTAPVTGVRILFADDVDDRRVALAAFVRNRPDPVTGWPSAAVWLVADKGASARELASTAAIRSVSDALEPTRAWPWMVRRRHTWRSPRPDVSSSAHRCPTATASGGPRSRPGPT